MSILTSQLFVPFFQVLGELQHVSACGEGICTHCPGTVFRAERWRLATGLLRAVQALGRVPGHISCADEMLCVLSHLLKQLMNMLQHALQGVMIPDSGVGGRSDQNPSMRGLLTESESNCLTAMLCHCSSQIDIICCNTLVVVALMNNLGVHVAYFTLFGLHAATHACCTMMKWLEVVDQSVCATFGFFYD